MTEVSTINARLDALEELTRNEEMFFAIRSALKPFLDMDRLLTAVGTTKPALSTLKDEMGRSDISYVVDHYTSQGEFEDIRTGDQ